MKMLTKVINFFSLNRPTGLLIFFSFIYLVLILKLKKILVVNNLINRPYLDQFLKSNKINKINFILHSSLIAFHLLLFFLLFTSKFNLFGFRLGSNYSPLSNNVSNVLIVSNDGQTLINSKNQAILSKNNCEANHFSSIWTLNKRMDFQINVGKFKKDQKFNDLKEYLKNDLNKNELNYELNDELEDNDLKNDELNELNKLDRNDQSKKSNKHKKLISKEDQLIFGQIEAIFLDFIIICLILINCSDTLISSIFEFKIKRKLNLNYQETNHTHIIERVLTPFIIYLDFKYFNNPIYLYFTISWSLLNIFSRFCYLKRLNNTRCFQDQLLLNDLLRAKVLFFSFLLLLTSYLMSLNDLRSVEQLPNSVKSICLFYSLIMFLISLNDWEQLLKQKDRTINLKNRIQIPTVKIFPSISNNYSNSFDQHPFHIN